MPEKIILEDGSEREVLTPQEVADLQTQAAEAKKVVELQNTIKEMEADVNPNFKEARTKIKKMREALKAKGIETDEDGNVVSKPEAVPREEIDKIATQKAREIAVDIEIEKQMATYDDKTRDKVKAVFDKLMNGEEKTVAKMQESFRLAEQAAGVQQKKVNHSVFIGGKAPVFDDKADVPQSAIDMGADFGITADQHKSMASGVAPDMKGVNN